MHHYYLASLFIGLGLGVAGLILLLRFGLPALSERKQTVDPKTESRQFLGRVGLALILAGFLLQIASNLFG